VLAVAVAVAVAVAQSQYVLKPAGTVWLDDKLEQVRAAV
jgi:hypothetical protein